MSSLSTFFKLIRSNPTAIRIALGDKVARYKVFRLLSDKTFIKLRYRLAFGTKINLSAPGSFNEKMNWLKLYNHLPMYTSLVDKYEVKKYVSGILGTEYVIPSLNVWNSEKEIDLNVLPDKFVLKCTHDSNSVVVCKDKDSFDLLAVRKKYRKRLRNNMFWWGREWPYKGVKPRVLAEAYMEDDGSENLPVYKFLCFNGEPRIIQTIQNDKKTNETTDYFDTEWNLLDLRQNYPNSEKPLEKPAQLDNMVEIARKMAKGFPFIRVDLFLINNHIFFSEFTFFSDCGFAEFHPKEWDKRLGSWIQLPIEKTE